MDHIENDFTRGKNMSRKYANLLKYLSPENKRHSRVIITHIFPNSYVKNFDIIDEFDIIDTVNNRKVSKLAELRKYLKLTKKISQKEYITMTTEINNSIVLSVQELLN